jgi:hypothetical protein
MKLIAAPNSPVDMFPAEPGVRSVSLASQSRFVSTPQDQL